MYTTCPTCPIKLNVYLGLFGHTFVCIHNHTHMSMKPVHLHTVKEYSICLYTCMTVKFGLVASTMYIHNRCFCTYEILVMRAQKDDSSAIHIYNM